MEESKRGEQEKEENGEKKRITGEMMKRIMGGN